MSPKKAGPSKPPAADEAVTETLELQDNHLAQAVYGPHNAHLIRIEETLGVVVHARGNRVTISGPAELVNSARAAMESLYNRAKRDEELLTADVDAALRLGRDGMIPTITEDMTFRTRKRHISPRSTRQAQYVQAMRENDLVFGLGPAGTGKTYMAVAMAVSMKIAGVVDRIILSRPAVEAGERLGFLPGDLKEKVDPYLRPLYDGLYDTLPAEQVAKALESGEIEVAPLAFMRGRTLSNAFVILDEAQNTTTVQMKMFLTRLGENSRMVVTGDLSQIDLPRGQTSGLTEALEVLDDMTGVGVIEFTHRDVVRHDLVTRIVKAYDAREKLKHGRAQ